MALSDLDIKEGVASKKEIHTIKDAQLTMTSEQLSDARPFQVTYRQIFEAFSKKQTDQVIQG